MEIGNEILSKETLNYLNIKNIYFTSEGITSLIVPVHIEIHNLVVNASSVLSEKGKLIIETRNERKIELDVSAEKIEYLKYTLRFNERLPEETEKKIYEIKMLSFYGNKRSELRYDIGIKKWKEFKLSRPDVFYVNYNEREKVKCVIKNASNHGVCLIGEKTVSRIGDRISFVCEFQDPVENMIQSAVIVNTKCLKANYYQYSLSFIEPISLCWLRRIKSFGEGEN